MPDRDLLVVYLILTASHCTDGHGQSSLLQKDLTKYDNELSVRGLAPSPSRCVLLAGNAQLRSAKFQIHATALTPNALEIYTAQMLQRKQIYFRWSSAN